eukprot:36333-Eustigmatos_ZCMA.PRE.1
MPAVLATHTPSAVSQLDTDEPTAHEQPHMYVRARCARWPWRDHMGAYLWAVETDATMEPKM